MMILIGPPVSQENGSRARRQGGPALEAYIRNPRPRKAETRRPFAEDRGLNGLPKRGQAQCTHFAIDLCHS